MNLLRPRSAFVVVAVPMFLLFGCSGSKPPTANYPDRDTALKECLKFANEWAEDDLSRPPYDITQPVADSSLLKNSKGQHKILDVYCKPNDKDLAVGILVPYIRFMEIPVTDQELHQIQDVVAGSAYFKFTYPTR